MAQKKHGSKEWEMAKNNAEPLQLSKKWSVNPEQC